MSSIIEDPDYEKDLKPALDLLGTRLESFAQITDLYQSVDQEGDLKSNVHITRSFDPQSHFENDIDDILSTYKNIVGESFEDVYQRWAKENNVKPE